MKEYYAYIRVSTTRQGEDGVSLQEQKRAILEYAARRGMAIAEWHEEQISAAQRGRPVFSRLVDQLKLRNAAGIIIHKIDRGARNLRDWADMADLMDSGIEVHFAHESIDLHTRSGRLSADILAVVAADYIRNLREETLKGFRGRLNQGLYPLQAPLGYLDNGGGRAKTIDPVRGHLVREAFRYFVANDCTVAQMTRKMDALGLRSRTGLPLSSESVSRLLRNPFYAGTIHIQGHGEFQGAHEPLISRHLFEETQSLLKARRGRFRIPRAFVFSRMVLCLCGYMLIGEKQKGHVYYRCHSATCAVTGFREELVHQAVTGQLHRMPKHELLNLAYRHASPYEKRMLLSHLKAAIKVRGMVRCVEGPIQLSCNCEETAGSSELGRILQEILMGQFQNIKN